MKRTLCAVGVGALCLAWASLVLAKCGKVCKASLKREFQADKAACRAALHPIPPDCGRTTTTAMCGLPATGQTTCWNTSGTVTPCPGTGQDGDRRAGAALAYMDNGDGTLADVNTGLMWEKQSNGDGSVHNEYNVYVWDDAFSFHVAQLNSGSFAGHTDWRVPNVRELASIVNYENAGSPLVSPAFNNNCISPCTVLTCSCTQAGVYWSSSSDASGPQAAWSVYFDAGYVLQNPKTGASYVRAVRGGS